MSLPTRSLLMWIVMLVAMMGNGFVRVLVLEPRLGEQRARQAASVLAVCIVLALAAFFVRGLRRPRPLELLGVGLFWLALTLAFEFGVGHYVSGASWEALLADYDLSRGRLWPLVLLTVLLGPWLSGLLRSDE